MAKKKGDNVLGSWAFLIGVVVALIVGLLGRGVSPTMTWVLVVLGLIVGLLNISAKETTPFLMSGAILVVVSALGAGVLSGVTILYDIVNALLVLFVPATVVVAIKHVFSLARN